MRAPAGAGLRGQKNSRGSGAQEDADLADAGQRVPLAAVALDERDRLDDPTPKRHYMYCPSTRTRSDIVSGLALTRPAGTNSTLTRPIPSALEAAAGAKNLDRPFFATPTVTLTFLNFTSVVHLNGNGAQCRF